VSDGKKEKDDARDKEIQRLNLELCKIKTGSCSYNVVDFDAYVQFVGYTTKVPHWLEIERIMGI